LFVVLTLKCYTYKIPPMNKKFKIKPEHKKYIRPVVGGIILLLGAVFMIVPFIPLGYIFLFGGLFLLSTEIPVFRKWLEKAKSKDKKNRIEKVEKTVEKKEEKVSKKIVMSEEEAKKS
jgi:uncharacterized membrane protein YbaN (DUF454 family)